MFQSPWGGLDKYSMPRYRDTKIKNLIFLLLHTSSRLFNRTCSLQAGSSWVTGAQGPDLGRIPNLAL
jgi:hypothetical protein